MLRRPINAAKLLSTLTAIHRAVLSNVNKSNKFINFCDTLAVRSWFRRVPIGIQSELPRRFSGSPLDKFCPGRLQVIGKLLTVLIIALAIHQSQAAVELYAGSGFRGHVDGVGDKTMFNSPTSLCALPSGKLLVFDSGDNRLRVISSARQVSSTTEAPQELRSMVPRTGDDCFAFARGAVYYMDAGGSSVVIVGKSSSFGFTNGVTDAARFSQSAALCRSPSGDIFVADTDNQRIRLIHDTRNVTTFAGSGNVGGQDGDGIFCSFNYPLRLAMNSNRIIYVIEQGGNRVRSVDMNAKVTTLSVPVFGRRGIAIDRDGNIFVASETVIQKYNPSWEPLEIISGFTMISDLACDEFGNLFIADQSKNQIFKFAAQAAVAPKLIAENIQTAAELNWTSRTGATYRVEWTMEAARTNWQKISDSLMGTGLEMSYLISTRRYPRGFYRVREE